MRRAPARRRGDTPTFRRLRPIALALTLVLPGMALSASDPQAGSVVDGLAALEMGDRATILARLAEAVHAPRIAGGTVRFRNPGADVSATLSRHGITFAPGRRATEDSAPRLHLRSLRLNGQTLPPTAPTATAGQAEFRFGMVTEWLRNDPRGYEQGWTVHRPPPAEDLRLDIALSGELAAERMGAGLRFTDAAGEQRLTYGAPRAWDANQRPLPARLELAAADRLQIVVSAAGAAYPVTIDPLITDPIAKLTAADAAAGDRFGSAVAIDGDTVVVGTPWSDQMGNKSGAAYVFDRNRGGIDNWGQVSLSVGGTTQAGDEFGASVAIDGDTVVVGAPQADLASVQVGAVYVFGRDVGGTDQWGELARVLAADPESNDVFGTAVAIDGDTLLVGAPHDDDGGNASGSAYVFGRNQGGPGLWGQVAKLTAPDASASAEFGHAVALSGALALIGAHGDTEAGSGAGAAYLFQRNTGLPVTWTATGPKLLPQAPANQDAFGAAVDLAGETAVVGSMGAGVGGQAFVFARHAGGTDQWGQLRSLAGGDTVSGDDFGISAAIDGDAIIIGAPGHGAGGAAYVFLRNEGGSGNWGQAAKLVATDTALGDDFGATVSVSGGNLVVGAPFDDDESSAQNNTGSVHVYGAPYRYDYGDAPDPGYPTLRASDGAHHVIGELMLGSNIDEDSDGAPGTGADGDDLDATPDDEDGVIFGTVLSDSTASVDVIVTGTGGLLDAWLDFNRDGDWLDVGERIFTARAVNSGVNSLEFTVPAGANPGTSYARFRLSSTGVAGPTAFAGDGEVEDHAVEIVKRTPALTASPASVDFGSRVVGEDSQNETVTLTNTGTATLVLGTMAISGAHAGDFAIVADNCPASREPGESCTVELRFTPGGTGGRNAQLEIQSNAPSSPDSVALTGTGLQAALTVAPASVDFGSRVVGEDSQNETVTLTNTGTATLVLGTMAISGVDAGDFAIVADNCPASREPGESCTVELRFTPTVGGVRGAALDIPSNAPSAPDSVGLGGTGVFREARLSADGYYWIYASPGLLGGTENHLVFGVKARLVDRATGLPIAGEVLHFSAGDAVLESGQKQHICDAVTDSDGRAQCEAVPSNPEDFSHDATAGELSEVMVGASYHVAFDGSSTHAPVARYGPLVRAETSAQ